MIRAEGDVAEAVTDLHAPVAADEGEHAGGGGAAGRQAGEEGGRLGAGLAFLAHGAHEASDLSALGDGDVRRQGGAEACGDVQRPRLGAARAAVCGRGGAGRGARVGTRGTHCGVQAGVVVRDHAHISGVLVEDDVGRRGRGVQGVGRDDTAAQRPVGQRSAA